MWLIYFGRDFTLQEKKKINCAENVTEAMSIQYVLNPKEENDCCKPGNWNTDILGHSHQAFYQKKIRITQ